MDLKDLAVIVLAAGKGTRFGESYTKLLHPIFGKPLIYYPIQNLKNLDVENIFVVVSDPKVEEEIKKHLSCQFVYQEKLTGTADAVKLAIKALKKSAGQDEKITPQVVDITFISKATGLAKQYTREETAPLM
mgnify:CR=1 FL=1